MASSQDILPPPVPHPTLVPLTVHRDVNQIIEHPNGSDGWLPAENFNLPSKQEPDTAAGATTLRRSTIGTSTSLSKRKSAFRSPPISRHATLAARPTEARQAAVFVDGPGTTVPAAAPISDEELQNRALSANNNLTPKQRSRIAKSEAKDGRRISKIIKEEGRTEKQALDIAINELEELQKLQKNAIKSEARAHANHTKSLFSFKKTEAAYLNAKMRYETALAELDAEADALDTLRNNSKEANDQVQEKSAQVDSLRTTLAVDEREREIKLSDLKGSTVNGTGTKRSGSLWRG